MARAKALAKTNAYGSKFFVGLLSAGDLLAAAGVSRDMFPKMVMPGTVVGELTDFLADYTGLGKTRVVAVAGHDTASAVAAVPAMTKNFAYLRVAYAIVLCYGNVACKLALDSVHRGEHRDCRNFARAPVEIVPAEYVAE